MLKRSPLLMHTRGGSFIHVLFLHLKRSEVPARLLYPTLHSMRNFSLELTFCSALLIVGALPHCPRKKIKTFQTLIQTQTDLHTPLYCINKLIRSYCYPLDEYVNYNHLG